MANQEIHLELLLSKQVLDPGGQAVGRVQEIHAEKQGDEWVVQEYVIGAAAVLERLSAWTIALRVLHLFGTPKSGITNGYVIPWDKLNVTDPEKPKLLCSFEELQKLSVQKQQAQKRVF